MLVPRVSPLCSSIHIIVSSLVAIVHTRPLSCLSGNCILHSSFLPPVSAAGLPFSFRLCSTNCFPSRLVDLESLLNLENTSQSIAKSFQSTATSRSVSNTSSSPTLQRHRVPTTSNHCARCRGPASKSGWPEHARSGLVLPRRITRAYLRRRYTL